MALPYPIRLLQNYEQASADSSSSKQALLGTDMIPHVPQPGHCSRPAAISPGSLIWNKGVAAITTLLSPKLLIARGAEVAEVLLT